jgi:type IV secretion system protein VirD4
MGFLDKLKRAIKKIKAKLIVSAILVLVIIIWAIAPFSVALRQGFDGIPDDLKVELNIGLEELPDKEETDTFAWDIFLTQFGYYITHPLSALGLCFSGRDNYGVVFAKTVPYFLAFYGLFILIGVAKAFPKHEYDDIEHGSSDWSEGGEQYKVLSKNKGLVLAEKNYLPVDKRGNVNVLVVGGSGAGKSASYVIPNALQLLGSYVFTDPKGELYDKTAAYFKEKGYDVKVLNLVHPQNSDGYNPLHHINNEIDVDIIANTIVKGQGDGKSSDPFWDDMSEMLMKALIYYLKAVRPPEEQSLASCSELVRTANSSGGDNLLTNLMNQLPYDHPARMYYKNIEMLPEKTFGSVLGTLQSKLGKFDSREIAEVTSTDTIDFPSIGKQKTAVFVISSDTHTAYDFLLTIFFSQMIQQLYDFADLNGGVLPVPTYFILDEFANIGHIPDFDKKISTSRSRKISFSVILQNLDQLESVYKDSHETIVGNCDTHLFLGSNSQKTVEYFSKALGEKTISRDSISVNKDREDWKQGKSESDQIMARALMTPDELRRLDNDLCIIYEKGIKPIKANKYYYFKYPEGKLVNKFKADHNDVHVERGVWRKYNPYNPYEEGKDENSVKAQSLESLNDLFEDVEDPSNKSAESSTLNTKNINPSNQNSIPKTEEQERQEELVDIQKELEAKFDELFGSMDEE